LVQLVTIHYDLMPEATRAYIREKNERQAIYQLPDDDVSIVETYRLFLYTIKSSASQLETRNTRMTGPAKPTLMQSGLSLPIATSSGAQ